jgi:hypothetical protein
VAAVSYDSVEVLAHFAERAGITYHLLSDPDSKVIDGFGVLNRTVPAGHPFYGFAYPGWYLVDPDGVVSAKEFNERNDDRTTAAAILVRHLDADPEGYQGRAETDHLAVSWAASNTAVRPGQRIALVLSIETRPGVYVYARGADGYTPIRWDMEPRDDVEFLDAEFPDAEVVHFPVLDEVVPVHDGLFAVSRDLRIKGDAGHDASPEGTEQLTLRGELTYQACDDSMCYFPTTIPMEWTVDLEAHDLERVPERLRRASDDG